MSKVIKPRKRVEQAEYYHLWRDWNGNIAQWIDCDKRGQVKKGWKRILAEWKAKPQEEVRYEGVQENVRHYWQSGVIKCDCGKRFDYDDSWMNTCPHCGADYDGNGNRLAPRSQWGYETGESLSDITTGVYNDGLDNWRG